MLEFIFQLETNVGINHFPRPTRASSIKSSSIMHGEL